MRSDLRSLRERIRQVEAGGHRDTPLRRAYNRKLRAHRGLRGGGGLPNEDEFNKVRKLEKEVESLKNTKVSVRYIEEHLEKRVSKLETSVAEQKKIWGMFNKLKTEFSSTLDEKFGTLDGKVNTLKHLDDEVSTLKAHIETIRKVVPELLELPEQFLFQLPGKFDELVDKVDSLEKSKHKGKKETKTTKTKSDSRPAWR